VIRVIPLLQFVAQLSGATTARTGHVIFSDHSHAKPKQLSRRLINGPLALPEIDVLGVYELRRVLVKQEINAVFNARFGNPTT
jgi:hypothetical protein